MTHTVLIAVHAASATLALLLGLAALPGGRALRGHLAGLGVMELSLVGAVVVGWQRNGPVLGVVFAGLLALGAVMCWRGWAAWRQRPRSGARPSPAYVGHVGFTLVSLVDAFVVVTVLDAGAPLWAVIASGVAVGVVGHAVLIATSARLTRSPAAPVTARAGHRLAPSR